MKNRAKIYKNRVRIISRRKDIFTLEYERIIGINTRTILLSPLNSGFEWKQNGDYFKKFTTFEEYTPVKTSGNTILCK